MESEHAEHGHFLVVRFSHALGREKDITFAEQHRPRTVQGRSQDPYKAFIEEILLIRRDASMCDGPDCGRLDKTDRVKLQRCSRCRVAHYCSPTCQKAHWKQRWHPHKEACPLFASLQEVTTLHVRSGVGAGAKEDRANFARECRAGGIGLDMLNILLTHVRCRVNHSATGE